MEIAMKLVGELLPQKITRASLSNVDSNAEMGVKVANFQSMDL